MRNIKLMIFEFKNNLTLDQLDESRLLQQHLDAYDDMSEKEINASLTETLTSYTYDSEIKGFLESVDTEVKSNKLVYDLKDLYKKVERKNLGLLYRSSLSTLLEIINRTDDDSRMEGILNDLSIFDWVPEIQSFLIEMTSNPIERENYKNSGKANNVYTIVERLEDGNAVWIADRWFSITESEIKQINIDDFITDEDRRREIRILENVMTNCDIENDRVIFKIDEHMKIAISTSNANDIYLNDEKLDPETTLETLFNSPLVPDLRKGNYILLETTKNNIDKFVSLDLAIRVENMLKPFVENFCFNYKDKIYMYSVDRMSGSTFYAYENASQIIMDVQRELDFDLTKFYENKLSSEMKDLKKLEEQEKTVEMSIGEIVESLDIMLANKELVEENSELKKAFDELNEAKSNLNKRLEVIKAKRNEANRKILNK